MDYWKSHVIALGLLAVISYQPARGETFVLDSSQNWVSVESYQGGYIMDSANLKKLINEGKIEEATLAVAKFKKDYPELDRADLDFFMEAEILLAKGDWVKAARKYQDFMDAYPKSWLFDAAIEREYSIASALLGGQKIKVLKVIKISAFEDGAELIDDIVDRVGATPVAFRALETLALSCEEKGDYQMAYDTWTRIYTFWPTGEIGQKAVLGMARTMHLAYKGPKYECESLISAKGYYENYALRDPDESEKLDVAQVQGVIVEQMAYKQLEIANYYQRTGSATAANVYYQYVIDNWPDTTAGKVAKCYMESCKQQEELCKEQTKEPRKGVWRVFDLFDLSLL